MHSNSSIFHNLISSYFSKLYLIEKKLISEMRKKTFELYFSQRWGTPYDALFYRHSFVVEVAKYGWIVVIMIFAVFAVSFVGYFSNI